MNIVGIMWARNEGDLIGEVIDDAVRQVDTLMIADDGSTDDTWSIIQEKRDQYRDRIEHIRQRPDVKDKGQRQALLDEVRKRYRHEDTWVQVIEGDTILLDTSVRDHVSSCTTQIALSWQMLNAARRPGTWREVDEYPRWKRPLRSVMPLAHRMEVVLYTFRPLPKLVFASEPWRPWPSGWSHYMQGPLKKDERLPTSPLVLHIGYRGPRHFWEKYHRIGSRHPKYSSWDLTSPETVEQTVSFFNGQWNRRLFPASREGWTQWLKSRRAARESTPSPT